MTTQIILGTDHAAAIRAAALAALPRECCGLLIGTGDTVTRIAPAPNTASDPTRHFEIDPQFLFDHLRSARETSMGRARSAHSEEISLRLIGHYHSHPNGRAEPSAGDMAMAHDPGAVWVIAAVKGDQVSLRAFAPTDRGFREIAIL